MTDSADDESGSVNDTAVLGSVELVPAAGVQTTAEKKEKGE